MLTEQAVVGFEYGYSTSDPTRLVIWEAQFGDFVNGAQVIIDQFISAGEVKWGRICGLVMLLPHGYEGQGPEHSSARPERFLQLCAQHNMQVCVPTTPAQVFHMLRRQMLRKYRKPLIVMSPKSLLRHKEAVSSLDDLANGGFQNVIGEVRQARTRRACGACSSCSGKVYYELARVSPREEDRRHRDHPHRAAVSVPARRISRPKSRSFRNAKEVVWVQEEPQNQGAWYRLARLPARRHSGQAGAGLRRARDFGVDRRRLCRKHNAEQKQLLEDAFAAKLALGRNGRRATRRRSAQALPEAIPMRIEVKVPQLPESVAEATLVNWHKKPGDAVKRDENLIDVETDKVVLELPAPATACWSNS